jgi:hypothetical protein
MHGLHGAKPSEPSFEQQPSGLLYPTKRTPFVEGGLGVSFRTTCGFADECAIRSIVSPVKSVHIHSVYGSTAFGPVVDARALAIADGTTCNYPQAKSIYWAPALYYRNPLTKRYDLVPSYTFHYYQSVGRFADNYIRKTRCTHGRLISD